MVNIEDFMLSEKKTQAYFHILSVENEKAKFCP